MTTQQPGFRTPDYEPPDFPPRGHRHPIDVVAIDAAELTAQSAAAAANVDRAERRWRDRETGRTAMFGTAAAVLVITVLIVLLVLWLVAVI